MPRRRRKKNYGKRRVYNQEDKEVISTGNPRTTAIIYKGIGIPNIFCTKLKFNTTISLTSGTYNYNIFRGNGAYDPDFAAGGQQPMYFDELTALWQRYCVLSSQIQVNAINRTATGGASFTKVGVYPLGRATPESDLPSATERDNCKYAQLGPNTGDQGIINITHYAKATQVLGKARDENTDDVLSALYTTNPARQWYWHVFAGTLDNLSDINVFLDVTLTYYVKFYDKIDVGRS